MAIGNQDITPDNPQAAPAVEPDSVVDLSEAENCHATTEVQDKHSDASMGACSAETFISKPLFKPKSEAKSKPKSDLKLKPKATLTAKPKPKSELKVKPKVKSSPESDKVELQKTKSNVKPTVNTPVKLEKVEPQKAEAELKPEAELPPKPKTESEDKIEHNSPATSANDCAGLLQSFQRGEIDADQYKQECGN